MDYADAVESFYRSYGPNGFRDILLTRAVLSDSVGGSVVDKRLVDVLYALSRALDIITLFQKQGLEKTREEIAKVYDHLGGRFTKREIVAAVNPLSSLFCPKEFKGNIRVLPTRDRATIAVKSECLAPKKGPVRIAPKPIDQVHAPPVPSKTNKPVLAKTPPKRPAISVHSIEVRTNARSLYFCCATVNSLQVSLNGKTQQIEYSNYVVDKNSILLPIDLPNGTVTLMLPRKRYKNITITGENTEIHGVVFDDRTGLRVLRLSNRSGAVCFNGNCGKVVVSTEGDVALSGSFASVAVKAKKGKANLLLFPNNKGEAKIHVRVPDGRFKGKLFCDRLKRPIGGMFHRLNFVKTVALGNGMKLDLDIKAGKGATFR